MRKQVFLNLVVFSKTDKTTKWYSWGRGGVQPESKICWIPRLKAVWHYAATRNYIFICVRHMNIKIRHLKEKALILEVDQELPWAPCPHMQLLAWYHHFSVPQATPTWHAPRLIYNPPHLNRLLFLLSYPKEQYQHLPSCKEKQIRRKHTNTISGAMICVVGFYVFYFMLNTSVFSRFLLNVYIINKTHDYIFVV